MILATIVCIIIVIKGLGHNHLPQTICCCSEDEKIWIANCGRGVHHHCSWLPLLQRLKLLTKWSSGPKLMLAGAAVEDSSPAVQGSMQSAVKTTAYSWAGKSKEAQQNLRLLAVASDQIWPILVKPAVTTCADYMARVQLVFETLAQPQLKKVPVFQASYAGPWVLRALLLALLRSQGRKALLQAGSVTATAFIKAVPDQCDWVERLLKCADREGCSCRTSFQDFLKYAGLRSVPPEYCTMHLCIWGSGLFPANVVEFFRRDPKALRMKVLQYKLVHGKWPHPLTLLETDAVVQWSRPGQTKKTPC